MNELTLKPSKLWQCTECHIVTEEQALLQAPSPFDAEDILTACPQCKNVGDFTEICDEPGCSKAATCGFPAEAGYRRTCGPHSSFWKA